MKHYDLTQLSILVAEPNSFLRVTLRNVLRSFNVGQTLDAKSIDEAWGLFQSGHPDIVFVDWSPGFNGLSLLKEIRRNEDSHNSFVPVVVVTSMTEYKNVLTARDMGATEFLAKPFSPEAIYKHLCAIVDSPRNFVRTGKFFGPDRRRRRIEVGNRQRKDDLESCS